MAFHNSGRISTDGLVLCLDAGNPRSYASGSTSWFDLSGNNNTGSLLNGPGYTGSNGGAIVFDGVNDYSSLGSFTGLGATNRTISVWFYISGYGVTGRRIITFPADDSSADSPAYTITVNASGLLQAGFGGTPYDGYNLNIPYTLNTWINLTSTILGNSGTIYRNGTFISSASNSGVVSNNVIGYIGRYNNFYGQYLSGSIAQVQVYNRALSAQEVKNNYDAVKSRYGLT